MNYEDWFFWVLILFLLIWVLGVSMVIFMTCCSSCIGCSDGEVYCMCYKRKGQWRQSIANKSLVTKTVERHDPQQVLNGDSDDVQNESKITTEDNHGNFVVRTKNYSISEHETDENIVCSVCLNSFHVGERVSWARYNTECQHVYHPECIIPWLLEHSNCPCCRRYLIDYHDLVVTLDWGTKKRLKRFQNKDIVNQIREKGFFCASHGLEFYREKSSSFPTGDPEHAECENQADDVGRSIDTSSKTDKSEQSDDQSYHDSTLSFCSLHDKIDGDLRAHVTSGPYE